MKISKFKTLAITVLAGSALFGGCLGILNPGNLLRATAPTVAGQFLFDNPAVLDLFPDTGVTTTTTAP